MAEKLDPKEVASAEELLISLIYTEEAIINLLEQKGLLTKEEVFEEIQRIKVEQEKKRGSA